MASTYPKGGPDPTRRGAIGRRPAGPALGILLLALWLAQAGAQVPISLDAESSELDLKNQQLVFSKARISQGDLRVWADTASSANLDFANATWELEGNVRIESTDGVVEASAATVRFENHRLVSARAFGNPARFERTPPDDEREIRGTAGEIALDATARTVTLTSNASVTDGANAITGKRLTYNLIEDRLLATSDGQTEDRVRVVIVPPEDTNESPGSDNGTEPPDEGDGLP
jgi:lipopolysaccharide transport protein LptA